MKKKLLALTLATVLSAGVIAGCGSSSSSTTTTETTTVAATTDTSSSDASADTTAAAGEYNIKVGHVLAQDHPYELGLKKLGEIANEMSDGQITVDVFGNSTLGDERDMVEGLQLGTQEMVLVSTAVLASFTDSFLVFDLPFLFETTEQARMVCDSDLGQEILTSADSNGIKGLVFFENGFRNVTSSKSPIVEPSDLEGLKIRTMESGLHMGSFSALGADPTPMAMGELFTALQQKTIDAQENPLAIIYSSKLYEVQDYISLTGHFYAPAPLFIATAYYESLPTDMQEIILTASKEAQVYEREVLDTMNEELVTTLEDAGVTINEVDKAPFIEAVQPVYDEWIAEGAGLVDPEIYAQVAAMLGK